jgi:aminopeptidase
VTDPRLETWAQALVGYSVDVKPGQSVAILGETPGEPLLRAIYAEVVARDAHPVIVPAFTGLSAVLMAKGNDAQLAYVNPVERFVRAEADVVVNVLAESNTKAMSGVDPARQQLFRKARTDLIHEFSRRSAEGLMDWTLTLYPTDAYAQDAGMATADFAAFVHRACKLDTPDPVAAWKELAAEQQRLIDWLAGKSEIHLRGSDTDLRLSVAGRTWINADGRKNFPDGEIFTGPVEDSVEGRVRFSFPVVTAGREIVDVRLRFEAGKVVDASAAQNEEYLHRVLETDAGARYLGEFAFGTNFDIARFTKNILFDEKIGGTVHMAVGEGYPESGSTNMSAVHWDLICDLRQGGEVDVDGEPFMRDGRFVV